MLRNINKLLWWKDDILSEWLYKTGHNDERATLLANKPVASWGWFYQTNKIVNWVWQSDFVNEAKANSNPKMLARKFRQIWCIV